MKPNLWTAITLIVLAAFGLLLQRYCAGPDEDYWVKREAYDQAVKKRDADLAAALERLARSDAEIAQEQAARTKALEEQARLQRENAQLRADDRRLAADNDALRTELQPVIDANPKLRELIQSFDLRLANKDRQILNLTLAYNQAKTEAEADHKSYLQAAGQAQTWKQQYLDEHTLRLQGDDLRLGLEAKYKASKFWAFLGKWGPPAAFALGLFFGR